MRILWVDAVFEKLVSELVIFPESWKGSSFQGCRKMTMTVLNVAFFR